MCICSRQVRPGSATSGKTRRPKIAPMPAKFVVATPQRSVCDDNARALEGHGLLRFIALGTRKGTRGVPRWHTKLNPWIGLLIYASGRWRPPFKAESFRFRLLPWFDRWVLRQTKATA